MTPLLHAYRRGKANALFSILSFMSDDEINEMVYSIGTRHLEKIVSHYKENLPLPALSVLSDELNKLLHRFERLNIVSNSGILAPSVESNTVNSYTPSFSNQKHQENKMASIFDTPVVDKKGPSCNK